MNKQKFDLDRRLFALALAVMGRNWLPCGLAALLLLATYVGSGYLEAQLAFAVLRSLIIMIVGYSAYRVLTSQGAVSGIRALATDDGRIGWRYAGVMLMILSPILVLGIVWNAPGGGGGPSGLTGIAFGVMMVVAYASIYVLFGTALPEVAERGNATLSEAFKRGRSNYRVIAKAMVFGPWLFRAASMLVMIGLSLSGVTVDLFNSSTGALQPAALCPMFMFSLCYIFAEVLTAVTLVRAYRRFPVNHGRAAVA
jgi:hypothetical protein